MYSFQAKCEGSKKQEVAEEPVNAHLLPFKIEVEGPAKVKEYFESIMQEQKNKQNEVTHIKTSLYGRELLGKQIELPEGISAHQFIRNSSNFERIKYNEINKCNLYEWKHDDEPHFSDKIQSNVVYLSIMSELSKE